MSDKDIRTIASEESGFTLIEVLVASVIIVILASLSITAFTIYQGQAEYSKAEATMNFARKALVVADLDLPDAFAVAFTQSETEGGPVEGLLAQILPGAVTPKSVRLGAEWQGCGPLSGEFDRHQLLVVQPCKGAEEVRFESFCGGSQVLLGHIANDAPCG